MTDQHTDAFHAAEHAALTAYGALHSPGEAGRVADALNAYRATLAAAGLLRDEPPNSPHAVVLAAELLARESRFPRYDGDGWKRLLESTTDVEVAHRKALEGLAPGEDDLRRDIAHARRILLTAAANTQPGAEPHQGDGGAAQGGVDAAGGAREAGEGG